MSEQYLLLGYVVDTFSLDGTLKILSKTDFADVRYKKENEVFLFNPKSNQMQVVHVVNFRRSEAYDFVKFKEINSPEEALKFKGFEVKAIKDYSFLPKDSYYYVDLIGCKIVDEKKKELGVVKSVERFPAQVTLLVKRKNGGDFFVPFVETFIKKVDIADKIIEINVIEGLL